MNDIFFIRRKGATSAIRQSLSVKTDGKMYYLHFLILDRTNPTKAQRAADVKAERIELLNQVYEVRCGAFIKASDFPLPKLVREFINFLQESEKHEC